MFMSPELLAPQEFDAKSLTATQESDIYAFGLTIFQVCEEHGGYLLLAYTGQVLTGDIPFRGFGPTGYIFPVVKGIRPPKPEDAHDIGFSDSLWAFVQRCWDGDKDSRPRVAEVVTHLAEAATNWHGLMPPSIMAQPVASTSEETSSGSVEKLRKLEIWW